jgi:glutathione S-transferase
MNTSKPVLFVFAISHYCEKARWALDYLSIDYKLRYVAPGEHAKIASELGAPHTHVPFLAVDGKVIQGSADIISWAEKNTSREDRRLTPGADVDVCNKIESRADEIAGVHIRRYYYSEALVEHPETVRPIFTRDLPLLKKLLISAAWGKIRGVMIKRMDLGADEGQESRDITEGELDWIDGLLANNRAYLVGESFSRADMTVASLLAPLALPPEHPTYQNIKHPPRLAQDVAGWQQRPFYSWVRQVYAKHR